MSMHASHKSWKNFLKGIWLIKCRQLKYTTENVYGHHIQNSSPCNL